MGTPHRPGWQLEDRARLALGGWACAPPDPEPPSRATAGSPWPLSAPTLGNWSCGQWTCEAPRAAGQSAPLAHAGGAARGRAEAPPAARRLAADLEQAAQRPAAGPQNRAASGRRTRVAQLRRRRGRARPKALKWADVRNQGIAKSVVLWTAILERERPRFCAAREARRASRARAPGSDAQKMVPQDSDTARPQHGKVPGMVAAVR